MDLIARVTQHFEDSIRTKQEAVEQLAAPLVAAIEALTGSIVNGGKILACGNGGSAADAQHFAAEMVGRFEVERQELAAIALTTDTSIITSIGNDYHFDEIFAKQVRAIGRKDDMAIGISTSGNSSNVVAAMKTAGEMGLQTLALTGSGGGKLAELADILFAVDSRVTARIQESHITFGHILCELTDRILFPSAFGMSESGE